jgi:hypothetical protein
MRNLGQTNRDNLNNVGLGTCRSSRDKNREDVKGNINELQTNSKNKI